MLGLGVVVGRADRHRIYARSAVVLGRGRSGRLRALLLAASVLTVACEPVAAQVPGQDPSTALERALALCPAKAEEIEAAQMAVEPAPGPIRQRTILAYVVDRALVPGWDSYPPWPILPTRAFTMLKETVAAFPFGPGDRVVGFFKSSRSSANGEIFLGPLTLGEVARPTLDPPPTFVRPKVGTNPLFPSPSPAVDPLDRFCNQQIAEWISTERNKVAQHDREQRALGDAFREAQLSAFTSEQARIASGSRLPDRAGDDLAGALSVVDGLAGANPEAHVKALMFTDLTDTAQTGVQPKLRRVDVIVALYRRADPADEKKHMDLWHERMCGWGAASVSFVKWAATSSDLLLDILAGKTVVEGAQCRT